MTLIFSLIGSLGIFLFGMRVMSDAIQKAAGDKLQSMMNFLTANRFISVFTGFFITGVIQSSSATTVILVSFVNAGLLNLTQAIGIIMGANIGTTVTAWVVAFLGFKFHISTFVMPSIAFGLPFMFSKIEKRRNIAEILIGFGLLFMGIDLLKSSVPDIRSNLAALEFLKNLSNHGYFSFLLFILVGSILTIIIQSSSATMAITITMAYKGWIPYEVACGMVLGENIGTTITAYLASLGMNLNARRAAWSHTLFNVTGVIWMSIVVYPFMGMIDLIIPGSVTDQAALPLHLSAFHTAFNLTNTFVLIWFVPHIAKLVEILLPLKPDELDTTYRLNYTSVNYVGLIDSNITIVKREIGKLSQLTYDMLLYFLNALEQDNDELSRTESIIDSHFNLAEQMFEEISKFLARCRADADEDIGNDINSLLIIVSELNSIAVSCKRLVELLRRRARKNHKFHKKGIGEILHYTEEVLDFIRLNTNAMTQDFKLGQIDVAEKMEKAINSKRDHLRKVSKNKMEKGADIRGELLYLDIIRHLEHLGDFSLTIAHSLQMM